MDILVTFSDGTTELRAPESACLSSIGDATNLRHPSGERWYLYFPEDRRPFSFCGMSVFRLRDVRSAWSTARVWRITGGMGEREPLTGEWQSAQIETVDEQIARLTRERDTEKERADAAEWRWTEAACFIRQNAKAAAWDSDVATASACERILTEMARLNMDRRPA